MDCRYRRYSTSVPDYLLNRPHGFVKHCLIKKSIAENETVNVALVNYGEFKVGSFTSREKFYKVTFGDENVMPKCTCEDWFQSAYLCKHFFMVFKMFPETWSWISLSSLYRESPFLTLDGGLESLNRESNNVGETIVENLQGHDVEEDRISAITEEITVPNLAELPGRKRTIKTNFSAEVRDMLNHLKNISYEFEESSEAMIFLHEGLKDLYSKVENLREKEMGIPTRLEKHMKMPMKKKSKENYIEIPLQLRKKSFIPRVGEKKQKMTEASKINLNINTVQTKEVEESIVTDDQINGEETFTTRAAEFFDIVKDDNIIAHTSPVNFEFNRSKLPLQDLEDLSNSSMLSDRLIKCLQDYIRKNNPAINGLQDPILGQNLSFQPMNKPMVQVIHNGKAHWLTISTYGCDVGEIFLLDSMFHDYLTAQTKKQICAIMKCESAEIRVKVVSTQQQRGGIDCGLFAIAFAQYISFHGRNPAVFFDQSKMRNHVLKCLKDDQLAPFPTLVDGSSILKSRPKEFLLKVFCTCRSIWLSSDKKIYGK